MRISDWSSDVCSSDLLCPEVQVSDIVEQVKRAFSWIRDNAGAYGCQAINMTASGHSAGAHLIAAALSDRQHLDGPHAALLISGIYELAPVLPISVNEEIRLQPDAGSEEHTSEPQ